MDVFRSVISMLVNPIAQHQIFLSLFVLAHRSKKVLKQMFRGKTDLAKIWYCAIMKVKWGEQWGLQKKLSTPTYSILHISQLTKYSGLRYYRYYGFLFMFVVIFQFFKKKPINCLLKIIQQCECEMQGKCEGGVVKSQVQLL